MRNNNTTATFATGHGRKMESQLVTLLAIGMGFLIVTSSCGKRTDALNRSTANVKRISPAQFEAEVIQADKPVLVDFYAVWCGPCRTLSPIVDELAGQLAGQIKFVKVNVDEAQDLAQRFQINVIPTLILFKGGKPVDKMFGLQVKEELKARLQSASTGS